MKTKQLEGTLCIELRHNCVQTLQNIGKNWDWSIW